MKLEEKLIEYRRLKMLADALESEIRAEVLERAESIVSNGIEVQYKTGRKTYKYEFAGKEYASPEIIEKHTKPKTDWAAVCKDAGLVNIPFTESEPTVAICIKNDVPAFPNVR